MPTAEYYEKRAELLLEKAEQLRDQEERFGNERDYPNLAVLCWNQRYERNGRVYTFTALKVAGGWYTSGLFQENRMSFAELVEKHLSKAVDGEVFIVSEWTEL